MAIKLYGSQAGWYYFINDHLGTPQKIVDSSGTVVWAVFYLPFGKAWAYPATITNNFKFPGQYYDAETGLHYNWHRYYDPDMGRYITADPIGLEGGVNLYAYVMGNPVNMIDPTGEIPLDFIWDALNIAHDVITQDWQSLTADVGAFFIPYFPAGMTKICKIGKAAKKIKFSPDDFSRAAGAIDRGGLTKAGRALQKHGNRTGSSFPSVKGGTSDINQLSRDIVDDILTDTHSVMTQRKHARFGEIIEIKNPSGQGLRYYINGNFIGFMEP